VLSDDFGMGKVKSYKDLTVWEKSVDLVTEIYKITKKFPKEEMYGLTSQITRAAISIPSNLAEGSGRGTSKSFASFLSISRGSLLEVETQLEIAKRLEYISTEKHNEIGAKLDEIGRMLNGLIRKIEEKV
jgi:four helix bundle protein